MASVVVPRKFSIQNRDIPPGLRSPPPRLPTKQYAMRRSRKLTSEEVKLTVARKGNYQGKPPLVYLLQKKLIFKMLFLEHWSAFFGKGLLNML